MSEELFEDIGAVSGTPSGRPQKKWVRQEDGTYAEAISVEVPAPPAPEGGATEEKQDDIISALGGLASEATASGLATEATVSGLATEATLRRQQQLSRFVDPTPHDSDPVAAGGCDAVLVISSGNLRFRGADEAEGFHTIAVLAGQVWPISITHVHTDTDADILLGFNTPAA